MQKLEAAMGSNVTSIYDIWAEQDYAKMLLEHDIFLNLHKVCGDPHNPVTWHYSKLLNAHGLIISERSHPTDEAEFASLIDFVSLDQVQRSTANSYRCAQKTEHGWATRARRCFTPSLTRLWFLQKLESTRG